MQAQGLGIGYWELGRDAGTGPDAWDLVGW